MIAQEQWKKGRNQRMTEQERDRLAELKQLFYDIRYPISQGEIAEMIALQRKAQKETAV